MANHGGLLSVDAKHLWQAPSPALYTSDGIQLLCSWHEVGCMLSHDRLSSPRSKLCMPECMLVFPCRRSAAAGM